MIYSIFLYQSHTGLLIYDKNFQDISDGKMEMFSSFFSAIKTFTSELVIDDSLDHSKDLTNIELKDYTVIITSIPKTEVDMVIIADKEDIKAINKLIPKLIKLLNKYEQLFISWDGNRDEFTILDHPLTELIMSNIKVLRKSLLEHPDQMLKSIWAHKKQLSKDKIENLIQERDLLIYKIENTINLPRKIAMSETVLGLSEKLKDELTFLKYQDEINRLKNELKDAQFKSGYYLEKTREALNEAINNLENKPLHLGDYKNTYLNLYSFSTKLKLINESGWEMYRDLASKLIEKDTMDDHDLSELIQSLLKMSSNIEEYLN
jgi:hypothetical protein